MMPLLTTLLNRLQSLEQAAWLKDMDFIKCKIDKDTIKELDTITQEVFSLLLIDININFLKAEMPPNQVYQALEELPEMRVQRLLSS